METTRGEGSLPDAGSALRGHVPWKQGASGTGGAKALYLAAEQTVNNEDEGPLQAVDDGEQVGHDTGHRSNLENAEYPGAPQDEELGKGLQRQQSGGGGGKICRR